MAYLIISKTIKCPDFGELKINTYIPHDILTEFLKSQFATIKQYNDLLKFVINTETVEISKLTDKDLECITRELTNIYNVEGIYEKLSQNIPRPEALQGALKKSPKIKEAKKNLIDMSKSLEDKMKELIGSYEKIFEPIRLHEETLRKMGGFQSAIKEIAGRTSFLDQLRDITKGWSMAESLSEILSKNTIDITKTLGASLSSMSLSTAAEHSARELFNKLSLRTNAIADALKITSTFHDNLKLVAESFNESITNTHILTNRFKLADTTIHYSEKLVFKANDYFSTWWKIPEIPIGIRLPRELTEKKEKLEEKNEKSEQLLEVEADTTIVASNGIVYQLIAEIRNLKEKINQLPDIKSMEALNRRIQILENPKNFLEHLNLFGERLGSRYWKEYWEIKGNKFVFHPERIAQGHLGMYLEGALGGTAFVGLEIQSGNGFIDIFVHCLGKKQIVEIKIIGVSWSIEGAEDGIDQLDEYMHSENCNESYLLVLDGRKTDRGRHLAEVYDRDYGRIYVVTSKIYWERPS
jgi:hypothetical protein